MVQRRKVYDDLQMMKFEDLVDMYVYGTCMAVEMCLSMPRVVVVSQSLPKYSVPQVRLWISGGCLHR